MSGNIDIAVGSRARIPLEGVFGEIALGGELAPLLPFLEAANGRVAAPALATASACTFSNKASL